MTKKILAIIAIATLILAAGPAFAVPNLPQNPQNQGTESGGNNPPVPTAPTDYTLLAPLNNQQVQTVSGSGTDFSSYLQQLINIAIAITGMLSVLMLIWGGLEYVFSSVSEAAKKAAKDRVTNAIFGLLIALAGYLILSTINPDLLKLQLPEIKPVQSTTNFGSTAIDDCVARGLKTPESVASDIVKNCQKDPNSY